jgi:hypothetical protein
LISITEEVELLLKKSKLFVKYEQDNWCYILSLKISGTIFNLFV